MDAPQAFTPPVRIATDFPFVNLKQDQDGNPLLETDDTRKVTINASCELLEHNFPGSFLKADSAVRLIYDQLGQPLVFSIGTNQACPCHKID